MPFDLRHGDCIATMRAMPDNSVDSIVTDPPYELGFMGKGWDKSGIANSVEMWREALRVLKPGGHLLAFSGSRTYHRMTCAIEDAGFEVRDQIMWLYGSGFPKSLDVSKAIDKAAGAEREVTRSATAEYAEGDNISWDNRSSSARERRDIPATEAARQWQGWGTALKPAHEPVCVARKPFAATVAANVLAHGTGALNIDGCRIGEEEMPRTKSNGILISENGSMAGGNSAIVSAGHAIGRWPANVIHDGLAEEWARFFYCPKASKKDREEGNIHPTVKPADLMRYLVRLVTPDGGTVLDPFMGSGSTGKAAVSEGFRFIGIDMTPEYVEIARARIGAAVHSAANDNEPATATAAA